MPELLCKVCGLTRPEDVELCHSLGVDFTGFIFARQSPRYVESRIAAALPKGPSRRVGVFVGADLETIRATAREAHLDMIQLHSGEDVDFCLAVGSERVIKVLWPELLSPEALAMELERFAPACAYFLLDAGSSGGGSGRTLPCDALRCIRSPRPWFLAGGLGPKSLPEALAACSPNGVDLNSALESAPGIKNPDTLRRAVALLKTCSGPEAGHTPEILP